jgi:histidyl-tRNA synthetase
LQSSICGGGRYDDLTGVFGLKGMSGVGISFGADRIYDVLLETNKFPAELGSSTKLLFANFGEKEAMHCLRLLRQVREAGIAAELYPDQVKLPKQFTYAEKKGIPYVAIVGETEMNAGLVTLKKMGAGEKGELMSLENLIATLAKA